MENEYALGRFAFAEKYLNIRKDESLAHGMIRGALCQRGGLGDFPNAGFPRFGQFRQDEQSGYFRGKLAVEDDVRSHVTGLGGGAERSL